MDFRKIDKSNYQDCILKKVSEEQIEYVADNTQSLLEATIEEGLYTLGIYNDNMMIGL